MGAVRCDLGRYEAMVLTYAIGYFMDWKTARGASSPAKPRKPVVTLGGRTVTPLPPTSRRRSRAGCAVDSRDVARVADTRTSISVTVGDAAAAINFCERVTSSPGKNEADE